MPGAGKWGLFFLLGGMLYGSVGSVSGDARTFRMGEKVAHSLCMEEKVASVDLRQPEKAIREQLQNSVCHDLDERYTDALLYYLHKRAETKHRSLPSLKPIPRDHKCPVCGMYPYKYPAWASMMAIGKTRYYFDGIKDMMKYYLLAQKYRYDRNRIGSMVVQDFYRLVPVDATEAWYVTGSDVRGPMGEELVPFASRKDAETFLADHHGRRIVRFHEIDTGMVTQR
jgi:nitrous oxide reductase accessory protein NosL